jgi:hypothetical protein
VELILKNMPSDSAVPLGCSFDAAWPSASSG